MGIKEIRTAGVDLELGGRNFKIKYTFFGLAYLAEKYGSVKEALEGLKSGGAMAMDLDAINRIVDFVYAGALWKEENLDRNEISRGLDLDNSGLAVAAILQALTGSMPEKTGDPQ